VHVIGIVGGVASGKSWVAGQFARLGAAVLDADLAGHEVLQSPEVEAAIRSRFGAAVFDANGRIDRREVAKVVFAPPPDGPRELDFLEQLTHPKIGQRLVEQVSQLEAQGNAPAIVLDAAVLLEAGWQNVCDQLVFVDAPREVRLERARSRGWSEKEFQAREQAQDSLESKRQRANAVIDNSGSNDRAREQIERFWRSLVG
jgi:dephospho-CoA kinase